MPAGIKLVRVDAKSGMRAGPGEGGRTILEAFKPGTAPPDNYSVIGVADVDGRAPQGYPQGYQQAALCHHHIVTGHAWRLLRQSELPYFDHVSMG